MKKQKKLRLKATRISRLNNLDWFKGGADNNGNEHDKTDSTNAEPSVSSMPSQPTSSIACKEREQNQVGANNGE